MHIAIEGLDGAGKTRTAKALAKQIGFTFIEKPLHFLTDTDGMENYLRMMRHINENLPVDFTALYYGMGNLYLRYLAAGKNVVTDRDLCSTWFWNAAPDNIDFFDYLVRACGLPDVIILLYAEQEARRDRIRGRNPEDPDLRDKVLPDERYEKMLDFVSRYHAKYLVVDNSRLTLEETVRTIRERIGI